VKYIEVGLGIILFITEFCASTTDGPAQMKARITTDRREIPGIHVMTVLILIAGIILIFNLLR